MKSHLKKSIDLLNKFLNNVDKDELKVLLEKYQELPSEGPYVEDYFNEAEEEYFLLLEKDFSSSNENYLPILDDFKKDLLEDIGDIKGDYCSSIPTITKYENYNGNLIADEENYGLAA